MVSTSSFSMLIIGEESIDPGIHVRFIAANNAMVFGALSNQDSEIKSNAIHLEALIKWQRNLKIPQQNIGEFIPYLDVYALIKNQNNGNQKVVNLTPHLNLVEGYHYARNIELPGDQSDKYQIVFTIETFEEQVTYHQDWKNQYPVPIITKMQYTYENISFEPIDYVEQE